MEAIDYNYFTTGSQPYQFLGYGENGILPPGHDDNLVPSTSVEHIASSPFPLGDFDYSFASSLGQGTGLTSMPVAAASPRSGSIQVLPNGSMDSGIAMDLEHDHEPQGRRSSSEEKENLTPAQSRRKAQNRAAQRAFRERKERHVRDLEAKLNLLTTTTSSLQSDNERLKLMLQRAQTENEILRATAATSPSSLGPPGFVDEPSSLASPRRKSSNSAESPRNPNSASPSKQAGSPGSENHLLSASAAWDLLQSHPLYLSGAIDVGEVCERLKKLARCDGMGPMFDEEEVRQVIEEVGSNGGDELV